MSEWATASRPSTSAVTCSRAEAPSAHLGCQAGGDSVGREPEKHSGPVPPCATNRTIGSTTATGRRTLPKTTTAPDEEARLAALHALSLLDTPPEERFDCISRLTQQLFDVPIVLMNLVDRDRGFFKSRVGF